jgi:hypothetical protein
MKFLKWLAILIVVIPVVVIASMFIRNKAVGPVGWAEDNTIKALKAKMRDPDSMVIRSSYVVQKSMLDGGTEIAICGVVDGKNGFGGFSGGTLFMSRSTEWSNTFDTNIVEMEDPEQKRLSDSLGVLSSFQKVYWNGNCVDDSHPALVATERK